MPQADAAVARAKRDRMLDWCPHFLKTAHQEMDMACIGRRLGVARIERQGPPESDQRRVEAVLTLPHVATAKPGSRPVRRSRDRPRRQFVGLPQLVTIRKITTLRSGPYVLCDNRVSRPGQSRRVRWIGEERAVEPSPCLGEILGDPQLTI